MKKDDVPRKVNALVGNLCATCEHNDDLVSPVEERDGGACFLGLGVCDGNVKFCQEYKPANVTGDLPGKER